MSSICPNCSESTRFVPTTDAENPIWFTCESCGEKVTKINHRYSPKIPNDAIIIPFEQEPTEEKSNSFLDGDLESKLAEALAIDADAEEEREKKIEDKKPLLEREPRKTRREVEDYFVEPDEEYEDEDLDIYEESVTGMLVELLKSYSVKPNIIKNIKRQSERFEENDESMSPRDLGQRLAALTKMKKEAIALVVSDYEKNLDLFEDDNQSSYRPSFDRDRRKPRGKEKEQHEDVSIIMQELNHERNLNDLKRESDKKDFQISRLEDKNEDLNREVLQLHGELRSLEQMNSQLQIMSSTKDTALQVSEVERKFSQQYSDDSMRLTADVIGKITDVVKEKEPLSKIASVITDRRMPSTERIPKNIASDQDTKTKEFEALTKPRIPVMKESENISDFEQFVSRDDFKNPININDLIVEDGDEQ